MHPVTQLFEWFPACDFAVLDHGLAEHGRDYRILAQTPFGRNPGRHLLDSRT
jgi:hypothetical protein